MKVAGLFILFCLVSCWAQETLFETFEEPNDMPMGVDDFKLNEIYHHGVSKQSNVFMKIKVKEDPSRIYKGLSFIRKIRQWRQKHKNPMQVQVSQYEKEEEQQPRFVPNPTDKNTILLLANMAYNSYENYNTTKDWQSIPGYDVDLDFGWKADGIRGYVFGNSDNSIMVIGIKGTTFTIFGNGETSENDKYMDNLMFSCCCARVDSSWDTVCGCYSGGSTCNNTCLGEAAKKGSYYLIAQDIYEQVRNTYPRAQIWLTGHSLGGGLAAVVAATNNVPAFTYEAPGDLLYALRLGLKIDPANMGGLDIFQFGNQADPIFTGECVGKLSACHQFGYAIETKCHVGYTCTYNGGIISNINNHRISVVIDKFIKPMDPPKCVPQNNCVDCSKWTYI